MSLRPTEPLNSTSPTWAKRMSLLKNTTLPGEWPGQCRMSKVNSPIWTCSPSSVRREVAHTGHAESRAARHHIVEQEFVCDMRTFDRHLKRVAQLGSAADM